VVDVEQRALRALEQDALALAALLVEQPPHRLGIGQQLRRERAAALVFRSRAPSTPAAEAARSAL
jgi:hypothetical protein